MYPLIVPWDRSLSKMVEPKPYSNLVVDNHQFHFKGDEFLLIIKIYGSWTQEVASPQCTTVGDQKDVRSGHRNEVLGHKLTQVQLSQQNLRMKTGT